MRILFVLMFSAALTIPAFAESMGEMNGIKYEDHQDFWNWELVTARYRTDTNEQRFTYANKLAAESLRKQSTDYPDGSVFVKAGYSGEEDPAFASSIVPSGVRRVQIMVRNKKKYPETDGWGYALFKFDGTQGNPNAREAAMACAACHKIVPQRGYVFSQFMDKSHRPLAKIPAAPAETDKVFSKANMEKAGAGVKFKKQSLDYLPANHVARAFLPKRFSQFQKFEGELAVNKFIGTFNEIVPALIKESARSGLPAALILSEHNQRHFSLVYPMNEKERKAEADLNCGEQEKPFFVAIAVPPFYLPKGRLDQATNLEIRRTCVKTVF